CLGANGRPIGIALHGLVISTRLLVHGFGISRIGACCLRSPVGISHGGRVVRLSRRPFLGRSHTGPVVGILCIGTREAQSERKGGCNDGCLHLRHSLLWLRTNSPLSVRKPRCSQRIAPCTATKKGRLRAAS